LVRHRGLFSVGLRIVHTVAIYPWLVVFWVSQIPWSNRFGELKEKLEPFGYDVQP
jgi:hypothetical protein